ncbi:MAG TPA: ribose-phosphate diphosphokinase [Candidatus Thermoplasmatota archaeon]|nr:ribose-phosphate diphosphokinase [Candidatus Thermoplasmatota archaeon]
MPPVVVPGTASGPFAARLAHELGAGTIRTEFRRFPDGEGYARLLDPVRGKDAVIVQSTSPDASLVELLLWQDAVHEAGAKSATAVIPYYAYARQDRSFQPGESVSSRAVARAIAAGCDQAVTVDIHKRTILDFFGGKATGVTAIPQIAAQLAAWGVDAVLAPDKGARDRAAAAADLIDVPVDHLEKTRLSPTEVRMAAKELDVRGRRVAIVDDLIASGSTMLQAAQQLKQQGATHVYAACTHGLFTGNALPRMLSDGIDRVLCTDTWMPGACSCDCVSAAPAVAEHLRPSLVH